MDSVKVKGGKKVRCEGIVSPRGQMIGEIGEIVYKYSRVFYVLYSSGDEGAAEEGASTEVKASDAWSISSEILCGKC